MILAVILVVVVVIAAVKIITEQQYKKLEDDALKDLGFPNWSVVHYFDEKVAVKSWQTLEKYDEARFFREHDGKLLYAEETIRKKAEIAVELRQFLENNEHKSRAQYARLVEKIHKILRKTEAYRIKVTYTSPAGKKCARKEIAVTQQDIDRFKKDPTLLMSKVEYNRFLREQQKEELSQKQHEYYAHINEIIDYANESKDNLIIMSSKEQLDKLIAQLIDRTVNAIKRVKTVDSEEWDVLSSLIAHIKNDIEEEVGKNQRILEYYQSLDFLKIKESCEVLMSSQREFNEYITEKVQSISRLFGTRVIRNETINTDEYNYIRPYKKTITPFTAEVSATVFASAENNPLEYIVKNFYPNKSLYPEQLRKLYLLVEELETLRDAKGIIENYKMEYRQYLGDVPDFVMKEDEAGFYSRLGFANIDESVLTVEYKFSYTSGGGMAQRSFTIPMTEDNIIKLIKMLENKLTASAFAREQRALMTKKLRESIKRRDNFTCCNCGNSTHTEPNLLLEIDHIVPVAKGGCTVEENLQTLCWKCNRAKSDKIVNCG